MTWDVSYRRPGGPLLVVEVEAFSISSARSAALPIVGSRSTIVLIERASRPVPNVPTRSTIQGASR